MPRIVMPIRFRADPPKVHITFRGKISLKPDVTCRVSLMLLGDWLEEDGWVVPALELSRKGRVVLRRINAGDEGFPLLDLLDGIKVCGLQRFLRRTRGDGKEATSQIVKDAFNTHGVLTVTLQDGGADINFNLHEYIFRGQLSAENISTFFTIQTP